MHLKPLPYSQIHKVEPLFQKAYSEMTFQRNATVAQMIHSMHRGYETQTTGIYLDDFENPKHCLVLCHVPGVMVEGLIVIVMLIYSDPSVRGNKEDLDVLHNTIENYAQIHGAETILGSSWKYKGSRGIDSMWKSRGYEEQETTYVKLL